MKKYEYGFLSALLVLTVLLCTVLGMSLTAAADNSVMYQSDYEGEDAKSVIRTENGTSSIVGDLPGDREGHAIKLTMAKKLIGVHPKKLGDELYKFGTFKEGDTFHFALDVYFDTEQDVNLYPFVLLCIFGEDYKKAVNYDEWYPSTGAGTLTVNEGSSVVPAKTWTTLDYTFTVKDGCSSKERDISFWKDGGAFYLYADVADGAENVVYIDNVEIAVDTENEPTRTSTTASTTKVTYESTATTTTTKAEESEVSETVVYGDVNGDVSVDMKDVLVLRQYIANKRTDIDKVAADVNGDTGVDMKDVLLIRKYIAKLIDKLR